MSKNETKYINQILGTLNILDIDNESNESKLYYIYCRLVESKHLLNQVVKMLGN